MSARSSAAALLLLLLSFASASPPLAAQPSAQQVEEAFAAALAAHGAGDLDAAAESFARAGEFAQQRGERDTAAAAFNNACVLWNEVGRYEDALAAGERAVELGAADPADLASARAVNNVGLALLNLGHYDEARSSFLRALDLNRSQGDAEGEVVNRTNLAIVAERRGDFHGASEELGRALAVLELHRAEPWAPARRAAARLNLGVLRERLGDFRGALDVLRPLADAGELADSPRENAVLLQNLGVVYRNLGDPRGAVDRLRAAEELYRRAGDAAGAAGVGLNLGIVRYLDLDDPAGALPLLERAHDLARELGDIGLEAESSFHLGRARAVAGDSAVARAALEEAFGIAERAGLSEAKWQALWGLALLDEQAGARDAALERLRSAMEVIEASRAALEAPAERGSYFVEKRVVYTAAVRVLSELLSEGRPRAAEEALGVAWRAKSRLLLDALGPSARGGDAAPPAVEEARRRLAGELLLEYLVVDDRLVRFRMDRDCVELDDRGPAGPVLDAVRELHRALARGEEPNDTTLDLLARVLLAGVFDDDPPERIAIAGDGLLRYVPFEILPAWSDRAMSPLLVELAAVRYLPSGAWLVAEHAPAATAKVVLRGYATKGGGSAPQPFEGDGPLPSLELAALEVERAAEAIGGPALLRLDDAATEQRFRSDAADPARVLHVAAHAVLAEDRGGASALVLQPEGDQDGLLRAPEIAELRLDVALAILSACSTSLGAEDDARALASLQGAFLHAGARGIVTTLWDVRDEDAASFVEAFAWELGRGHDAAEALRRTKLRFLRDERWASPARWAAFVLVGESTAIRTVAARRALPWLAGAGAIAAAAALVVALRGRQRQNGNVSTSSNGPRA